MRGQRLNRQQKEKNVEFYTLYHYIEKEINIYYEYDKDVFRDKVIYCNCDNPYKSNFAKYFVLNFKKFGLKRLIATCYKKDSKGLKLVVNETNDIFESLDASLVGIVNRLVRNKNNELTTLNGNGDFRSDECVELLKQSDIIITNPPFSLLHEFFKLLFLYEKKFLIVGNLNAVTYTGVFSQIKQNKMWLGHSTRGGNMIFLVSDEYNLYSKNYFVDDNGNKYIKIDAIRWFTNLEHGKQPKPLRLKTMQYNLKHNKKIQKNPNAYKKYDNYDAIEVPYTDAIPSDYEGVMGVPISFLDKYNPDQFEILGSTRGIYQDPNKIYGRSPYINGKEVFNRIFIKHKNKQK
jgi:hypothetical protein